MFTTRPEIAATFGAVASTHWIASQVGMAVLERGGNAFDAAAAAGFTLQIVEPHLNGPGGDCPIILHSAKLKAQQVICGQGPAPRAMTVGKLKDELGLDIIPGTGFLCAPIPGAFDAWAAGIAEIAAKTPVYCKLSGLATEAKADWNTDSLRPYAEHIIRSFGPARVMWGSDWPVVNLAGGFDPWRQAAEQVVGQGPAFDRIFGGTATEFYRLA